MNNSNNPKDKDVHYKNGVCQCKHCGKSKRGRWPITLQDMMDGVVEKEIEAFKAVHDRCALRAHGLNHETPTTMIEKMPGMMSALNMTLTHLLTEAEKGGPKMGTALTSAICEVEVHGRPLQIQMRIEADPKSFIGENELLQSHTLNSIGGN